ncbi:hypothetical protein [Effusibacillus consociatus]|uniref:Uncharacterized protein n=1 Tax=Effusibacillus consociatus TaxID=1117041 RepID=A0ABV9PZ03_9BACL
MAQQTQELKRLVERRLETGLDSQPLRMDEFIDRLRREISLVRREDPTLDEFHLHDVKLSFQNQGIILQIDFRR